MNDDGLTVEIPTKTDPTPPHPNKWRLVALIFIIASIALATLTTILYIDKAKEPQRDNQESEQKPEEEEEEPTPTALEKGTFTLAKKFGTFQAKGFAFQFPRYDCDPGTQTEQSYTDCTSQDFVSFHITDIINTDWIKYHTDQIIQNATNSKSYTSNSPLSLQIGCLEDGQISFTNHSDEKQWVNVKLSKSDTAKILNSTIASPITLEFEYLLTTAGFGPPVCYSDFSSITIKQ